MNKMLFIYEQVLCWDFVRFVFELKFLSELYIRITWF